MLFSSEIESLHDDGFEGSADEHNTCRKVYFGNDGGRGTKRCLVTGVINFENVNSKDADISLGSNSGSSALTSQEDPLNVKEDPREKSEPLHVSKKFEREIRENPDVAAKRMKFSIDGPSDAKSLTQNGFGSSAPLQGVISDVPQSASCFVRHNVTCRIVESAGSGVSCSCYLLKKHNKMEFGGDTNDDDCSRFKLSSVDGREQKEVGASKAIASPVSQESSATKLLISSSAIVANDSGCHRPSKPRWKDSCFVELDEAEMSLSRESKNDPRPLLRFLINRLLTAAGWVVGRRKRSSTYNGIGEYVYKSPEGRPMREFRRAWVLCGHSLFEGSDIVHQERDVKQYIDLAQFWSALNESSNKIKEMEDWETTSALAHCWYLLDPLAKVLFIDKQFSSLKAGKIIQAKRSFVVRSKKTSDSVFTLHNVENAGNLLLGDVHATHQSCRSSQVLDRALVVYNKGNISEQDKYSEYLQVLPLATQKGAPSNTSKEKSGRNIKFEEMSRDERNLAILSLQAYGSDSSSDEIDNDLFGVRIGTHDANLYLGCDMKNSPLCSAQQQNGKSFHHIHSSSRDLTHADYNDRHVLGLSIKSNSAGDGLPVKRNSIGSGNKPKKPRAKEGNGQKKSYKCRLKDDDLLISAIIKKKSCKSTTKQTKVRKISCRSKSFKKRKNQKGSCRLLPRSFNRSGVHYKEGNCLPLGSRTVLSWLINSGNISLNEVVQYRNTKDDTVVKDGLVTWDGILCRCCETVLSVSEFKSHSGFRLNRPCLNLFMESGKPFTLCQLEAWSAEYKARKSPTRTLRADEADENDDSCGLCGVEGELICCDNCPSTFHRACLYEQEIPEGSWYCSQCTCQICGDLVNDKESSNSPNSITCYQCEHKYHERCLKEKCIQAAEDSDIRLCGEECYKVYSDLHSRVGHMNLISDGLAWTLLRCIHGDKKFNSGQRFVALKAECNLKLAVALTIMEECFLPMVDARTGVDMIPHVLYNWGSRFARLNYHGFYTVVLEKNDVLLSAASIRIHGATVAEMPLIATCSRYRRQGMCRHLMNVIEEMLMSIKVEKLVISAIPDLVETWTKGFGFERLEDDERRQLRRTVNLMVFPGSVWLKKSLSRSQVSKDQQIGEIESCNVSPSEKDDLHVSGSLVEEPHGIQPASEPEVHMTTEELDVKTELVPANGNNIQIDKDLKEAVDIRCSKLSCEEKEENNQSKVYVDSMEVYIEREHTEQVERPVRQGIITANDV
ncbi:increased DNA methylation 1 isoform X1 [Daucus carota subsp. sativus]|uniref:increased DNA methylation 1 isoform X1 n=1 Tax=Daucus carota subsp. sativus TaxID=79200 RepID=UPI0007EF2F81|nr:PREDICTED: increased DNA methylation 1-like [Daucus carota subsp. sativus]